MGGLPHWHQIPWTLQVKWHALHHLQDVTQVLASVKRIVSLLSYSNFKYGDWSVWLRITDVINTQHTNLTTWNDPLSLWTDLYVPAASHFCEVLMLFQGFIHLIVGHAVAAQAALTQLIHLCKHHKLGHVGHSRQLSIEQAGKGNGFSCPRTVCKPESERKQWHIQYSRTHVFHRWAAYANDLKESTFYAMIVDILNVLLLTVLKRWLWNWHSHLHIKAWWCQ